MIIWPHRDRQGLSPRVRGNPIRVRRRRRTGGAIPASAGEPDPCPAPPSDRGGYPRECGGTGPEQPFDLPLEGLSPRVRGNRRHPRRRLLVAGAIPASAGEPWTRGGFCRRGAGYPRECGGTSNRYDRERHQSGLSPRVRGNPSRPVSSTPPERAIPASAGEPPSSTAPTGSRSGLSPRVRGNHAARPAAARPGRAIPASAGEPDPAFYCGSLVEGYPRECGGTYQTSRGQALRWGLSPRVRGNPGEAEGRQDDAGAIPASAGEPARALGAR